MIFSLQLFTPETEETVELFSSDDYVTTVLRARDFEETLTTYAGHLTRLDLRKGDLLLDCFIGDYFFTTAQVNYPGEPHQFLALTGINSLLEN